MRDAQMREVALETDPHGFAEQCCGVFRANSDSFSNGMDGEVIPVACGDDLDDFGGVVLSRTAARML